MADYYEHLYLENLNKSLGIEKIKETVTELGKLKSKRAYPKILEIALKEKNELSLRLVAIMALTEIGISNFLDVFSPFEKNEEEILELIIIAIGELKAENHLEELKFFINYKNFEIKKHIIEALEKIDSFSSLKLMIYFYNDKDYKVKELVKQALQNSHMFKAYIETMTEEEILNIITLIPVDKAETLILKLIKNTKNIKILRILISAIGDLKLTNAFKLLKKLYNISDDKSLKVRIIESCEKLKTDEKKEFLLEIINSDDRDLIVKAILSLNGIAKDEDVQDILEKISLDSNQWWMARKLAIISLTELEKNKFLPLLKNETDQRVLRSLIQQMGDLGEIYSIQTLESFISDKNLEIKKVAVVALSKLGSKNILESLIENKDLRDSLKPDSLKAISNFQDKRVTTILLELLKSREEQVYDICLEGLAEVKSDRIKEVICDFTKDKSIKRETRAKALMLLASYKDKYVENTLKSILDDEDEWWMLKKLAIIISGELSLYSLAEDILNYANGIDNRIKKSAREVSTKFYKNYILETLKKEKSSVYDLASSFSKLF